MFLGFMHSAQGWTLAVPSVFQLTSTLKVPNVDEAAFAGSARREGPVRHRSDLSLPCQEHAGAGEGIRTLDPNLGKVVLYP